MQALNKDEWHIITGYLSFKDKILTRSICQLTRSRTPILSIPSNVSINDDILKSIKGLTNLTTFDASYNSGITDVSMLTNLTTLYANHSSGITDVSMLTNLTTLYAYHSLKLTWCNNPNKK
jgi:hypothetical protein